MKRKDFLKLMGIAGAIVSSYRAEAPEGFDPQATATTISTYGTEAGAIKNVASAYAPLKPNQAGGRVRCAVFTRVYASEVAGDITALCVLPKGARILRGEVHMSASGGSTTFAFGLMGKDGSGYIDDTVGATVSDNQAILLTAQTITTTALVRIAATNALSCMYETTKELWVTVTTGAATIGTQTLTGFIEYVVD